MIGVDAHDKAAVLILTALHRRLKVPAVQQHSSIAHPDVLVSIVITEHNKWVVLVAGCSPYTAYALYSGAQRPPVQTPFHEMVAVESNKVHIAPEEVQTQGGAAAQVYWLLPYICYLYGACDKVQMFKHSEIQTHHHLGSGIVQMDDQGLGLCLTGKEGGQTI